MYSIVGVRASGITFVELIELATKAWDPQGEQTSVNLPNNLVLLDKLKLLEKLKLLDKLKLLTKLCIARGSALPANPYKRLVGACV